LAQSVVRVEPGEAGADHDRVNAARIGHGVIVSRPPRFELRLAREPVVADDRITSAPRPSASRRTVRAASASAIRTAALDAEVSDDVSA
jgi:hypothetical protein